MRGMAPLSHATSLRRLLGRRSAHGSSACGFMQKNRGRTARQAHTKWLRRKRVEVVMSLQNEQV